VTAQPPSLRLVSYNLRDLTGDRDAVAHVLRSLRCDVACLQEVPRRWFQRGPVRRLARECGMRWVSGGRGSGGTAVFVGRRPDVVQVSAFRLPVRGLLTRTRGAATATVSLDGARLTAVSVHLPLRPDERVSHARMVRERTATLPASGAGPTSLVIAGDLNEPPDGPAWAVLGAGLTDAAGASGVRAPTFPSWRPARRIDAVLVGPAVRVAAVQVPGSTSSGSPGEVVGVTAQDLRSASDHLPIVVDLLLAATG
jgi:endonuclease/exonuclease/phosphatase family metal-dependent hydrolase